MISQVRETATPLPPFQAVGRENLLSLLFRGFKAKSSALKMSGWSDEMSDEMFDEMSDQMSDRRSRRWPLVRASICKSLHLDPVHRRLLVGQSKPGRPRSSVRRSGEVPGRQGPPLHDDHGLDRLGPHSHEHRRPLAEH